MDFSKISMKIFGEEVLEPSVGNALETTSNQSDECNPSNAPSPETTLSE